MQEITEGLSNERNVICVQEKEDLRVTSNSVVKYLDRHQQTNDTIVDNDSGSGDEVEENVTFVCFVSRRISFKSFSNFFMAGAQASYQIAYATRLNLKPADNR